MRLGAQTAGSDSLPAPIGGLNDRDSLADMPATDAVILDNWWPLPSKLVTRKGYTNWATAIPNAVETLLEYAPPTGIVELYAIAGGKLYDVSKSGDVGDPVVSDLTNSQWQDAAITTAGGSFLYAFNGADKPLLYDGTAWISVDGDSTTAITGVTTSLLIQGCVFKNRLFMVEVDSLRCWYLPVSSIGGAATSLDFGSIFRLGGYLVAMFTWTIDAGSGSDDHAVFISSNGEVAVYAGSDPSDATNWNLVGVFYLGRPIGRRCAVKYGGDLMIICEQGVYPLGKGLLSSSIDRRVAITDKIQNSINSAINAYKGNTGWGLTLYPEQSALILNIPAGNDKNYQLLQNTITQAWTKFTGWNASCFRNTSLGLFFGDATGVRKAWTGNIDGDDFINCDVLPAFNYFQTPTQNKYFTLVKPYLQSDGTPAILYGINGDFVAQEVTGTLNYVPPNGMIWGSMIWGSMIWGGSMRELSNWNTAGGIYKCASLRMKVQNNFAQTEWASTQFVYQRGGIL